MYLKKLKKVNISAGMTKRKKKRSLLTNLCYSCFIEAPFDPEYFFVEDQDSQENNPIVVNKHIKEAEETIEYKVNIPENPYTTMQKYTIWFEEVCDSSNISREGSRAMRHFINTMLADERLGKNKLL